MNCKKAIILAAGTASRLRPLTLHTPKCLLKVGERTLLERSMDALIKAGIREFCIVTGYLHEKIEDFVKQTYGESIDVCFIHNKDTKRPTTYIRFGWLVRKPTEKKYFCSTATCSTTDKSSSASSQTVTKTSSPSFVTNLGKRR